MMHNMSPWLIVLAAAGGAVPGLWIMTYWFAARQRYRRLRRVLNRVRHERDVLRFQMTMANEPARKSGNDQPVRTANRVSPGQVNASLSNYGKRGIGFKAYVQRMTVAAITTSEQGSSA